jgi:hypothetical protein
VDLEFGFGFSVMHKANKAGNVRTNATLWRVRATIVAVEKH